MADRRPARRPVDLSQLADRIDSATRSQLLGALEVLDRRCLVVLHRELLARGASFMEPALRERPRGELPSPTPAREGDPALAQELADLVLAHERRYPQRRDTESGTGISGTRWARMLELAAALNRTERSPAARGAGGPDG